MNYIWQQSNNLNFTTIRLPSGDDVLTVYDVIAKRFFFSLNDVYSSVGHNKSDSLKRVSSSVYTPYYKPYQFNIFQGHVFIRLIDMKAFLQRFLDSSSSKIKKEKMQKNFIYLATNVNNFYSIGVKKKSKNAEMIYNSHLTNNGNDIHITYVDGHMMLNVRDLMVSLGYSRDSGLSGAYKKLSHVMEGTTSRYIPLRNLPPLATKAFNKQGIMNIYDIACKMHYKSHSLNNNGLVINKETKTALFKNKYVIPIQIIPDVSSDRIFYQVSGLSKAVGLSASSKSLLKCGAFYYKDGRYVNKKMLKNFLDSTVMPNDIKDNWIEFYKVSF